MASPAQITANHANAAHSTGPKTESGKRRSSLNAIRHGVTSHLVVLPTDDVAAYNSACAAWFAKFEPKDLLETHLTQTLADAQWRLSRIRAQETYILAAAHAPDPESGDDRTPLDTALAEAEVLRRDSATLNLLSIHEQRLNKLFLATLKQLQLTQQLRKATEHAEVVPLQKLSLHCQKNNLPFEPKDFGFVLTKADFDLTMWRIGLRQDADTTYQQLKNEAKEAAAA